MFNRYVGWFESDEESEWRTKVDEARYHRARQLSDLVADRQASATRYERTSQRRGTDWTPTSVAVLALGVPRDAQARFKASASIMDWFALPGSAHHPQIQ